MVSIVIPARNEQFLTQTIKDLLKNAEGEIEIIAVLDGYWPSVDEIVNDPRVIYLHKGESEGMRSGINDAVAISNGKYIMKIDAHCMVDKGFDVKLAADCEPDWVVIPRRYSLDAEKWERRDKSPIDSMYLSFPDDPNDFGGPGLNGKVWKDKGNRQKEVLIDDEMSFQGSSWFMHKDYFYELELMDEENYGPFWNEAQEIGLKAWLSGGRVVRNKKTWYAHLHKGSKYGRGYFLNKRDLIKGARFTKGWMTGSHWHKQSKPLSWLIERFWPVPTWNEEGLDWLKNLEKNEK